MCLLLATKRRLHWGRVTAAVLRPNLPWTHALIDAEFNRTIRVLAEELVDGVIRGFVRLSLRDLAAPPDRNAISQTLRVMYDDELIAKCGSTRAMER